MRNTSLQRGIHNFFRGAVLWRKGVVPQLYYHQLKAFNMLSAEEKQERSFALLRQVVFRAYHNVPFYKRRFDELILNPCDLRSPEDLTKFPILSKQDVIKHEDELISNGRKLLGARWDATGGSTGEPLRFLKSRRATGITYANEDRVRHWYGLDPGARQA